MVIVAEGLELEKALNHIPNFVDLPILVRQFVVPKAGTEMAEEEAALWIDDLTSQMAAKVKDRPAVQMTVGLWHINAFNFFVDALFGGKEEGKKVRAAKSQ